MHIDHAVLWVEDPQQALVFYSEVLGLTPVRAAEFAAGDVPFPSVRVSEHSIIDLMARDALESVRDFTGSTDDAGGMPINHLCLCLQQREFDQVVTRLEGSGVAITSGGDNAFGAQGEAVKSVYCNDPDGNVIELRYYPQV